MNLKNLIALFNDNGCTKVYVKILSPNDNSKNQVYLGGNFEILNILPISKIEAEEAGNWERERFKAALKFNWADENGQFFPAPHAKLILYPKYPEVRLSGFLTGCVNPPSNLMTTRLGGRLMFLGVSKHGSVMAYVSSPDSIIANQFNAQLKFLPVWGVFYILELSDDRNDKQKLLEELHKINLMGWVNSRRLDNNKNFLPCNSSNCGGYTLEALLGISPNGYSEPDFLGWEIKQFGVASFEKLNSSIITLMTPEPTGGLYFEKGVEAFIHKYGYNDLTGKPDRKNFGGIHKIGIKHSRTNLTLNLFGFDSNENKIRNANGMIALVDENEIIAASWNFSSLLLHWNRKHNHACYVPSISETASERKYMYGNKVILGEGTDFHFFLKEMSLGNIYYDPGIKLENISTQPKIKRRSQFRIKSLYIKYLYKESNLEVL